MLNRSYKNKVIDDFWKLDRNDVKLYWQQRRAELTTFLLEPNNNDVILDVGCGVGYQLSYVAKRSGYSIGLDLSSESLKEAKSKLRTYEVDFIQGSSNHLPFRSKVFDKILCLELLEHLPKPSKCVIEIERCLKTGGSLMISAPYKEKIMYIPCVHCGRLTPIWGHLHSFDERKIVRLVPESYRLLEKKYLNVLIRTHLKKFPFKIWLFINDLANIMPIIGNCSHIITKFRKCQ